MKTAFHLCALLLMLTLQRVAVAEVRQTTLTGGRFGTVTIYSPEGPARSVALFVSGDGGWSKARHMAQALTDYGAIVAGIDIRHYFAEFGKSHARCESLAVDFENLSHRIQKKLGLPQYHVPVLVGYSSGATLVYAALAQAPTGTFDGALSLGFCADQDFKKIPLCPGTDLHYKTNARGDFVLDPATRIRDPWIGLQGQQDQACDPKEADTFAASMSNGQVVQLPKVGHGFGVEKNWMPQFRDAYHTLAAHKQPDAVPLPNPEVADLPLVEVPATRPASGASSNRLVFLMTGDGGWAGIDRDLANAFADAGIPVVGLSSLRYFWQKRTPSETAGDVARTLQHYLGTWGKDRVDLVGDSFGAEVLPFVVNAMPEALRAKVDTLTMISPTPNATWEIQVADWLPGESSGDTSGAARSRAAAEDSDSVPVRQGR